MLFRSLNYKVMAEDIKEWTNVLGLGETPTGTDTPSSGTTRQYWKNSCGYTVYETFSLAGVGHAVPFTANAVATYFGLDQTGGQDPEAPACGGTGGTGGTSGTGGARTGGASTGGLATGGQATGGRPTGGTSTNTGGRATGGMVSSGGVFASGGAVSGGTGGALLPSGGSGGQGGGTSPETCNCRITESGSRPTPGWLLTVVLLLLARACKRSHGRSTETVSQS